MTIKISACRSIRPLARAGFTLIELLIAMVIVGILAAIAIPSYQHYIVKSNRRSAQSIMMDMAQKEQQYILDARSYGTNTQLNYTVPNDVSQFYTITATPAVGPPPSFTITATPVAGTPEASDPTLPGGSMTLDNLGSKLPSGAW